MEETNTRFKNLYAISFYTPPFLKDFKDYVLYFYGAQHELKYTIGIRYINYWYQKSILSESRSII